VADTIDDPILREIDEELRQEKYLQIWRKYRVVFIGVVVVVICAVAGYQGWRSYTENARRVAGEQYSDALRQAQLNQVDSAAQSFARLAQSGPEGYSLLARFEQATLLSRKGDNAGAVAVYHSISDDRTVDEVYRGLAVILQTLTQLDSGEPTALIQRLAPLISPNNAWQFSARELTGILAFRKGDIDQAQNLFSGLANDAGAPPGVRERSAAMLGVLGTPQSQQG